MFTRCHQQLQSEASQSSLTSRARAVHLNYTSMQNSYDAYLVVLSGLPIIPQQSQRLLNKFILRKLLEPNPDDHSKIYVPVDGLGNSLGYV